MLTPDDVRVLGRALSGRALSGEERTDARWNRPGTQTINGHRHAGRRHFRSFRRRAATRAVVLVILVAAAVGIARDTMADTATVATVARMVFWLVVLPGGGWAWWEWSRRYAHRRDVVRPLAEALSARLNDARYEQDPRTWLHVPVDVHDRPTRVLLPPAYDPTDQQVKSLVKLVARRVGLVAPSHTLDLRGEAPFLDLVPAPAPRDIVRAADPEVRRILEAAEDGRPVLGLAPRDEPYGVNLDADAPHVGFSMATNAGKSVTVKSIVAQGLRNGGIVVVLDRKVESQIWCMNHPGVRYACSEQEIYNALMWVSDEIDRRFATVRRLRSQGLEVTAADIGPRLYLVVEELNTLEIDLRIWWRSIRQTGDPAQCPALPVLGRYLAMGRAARAHALVVAQKLTCQAIGGTAARENLSTRILARATTSTWNMLAPECKVGGRYPRSSKHRGRVHVVFGDEATPVQTVWFRTVEDAARQGDALEQDEALTFALEGTVTPFPSVEVTYSTPAAAAELAPALAAGDRYRIDAWGDTPYTVGAGAQGDPGGDRPTPRDLVTSDVDVDELGHGSPEDAPEPTETLAEAAVRLELGEGGLTSLRNASKRDRSFPEAAETAPGKPSRYRVAEVDEWHTGKAARAGDAS